MSAAGVELSEEELLDVLWLAAKLPADVPLVRAVARTSSPRQTEPNHRKPTAESLPHAREAPRSLARPETPPGPGRPLHAAARARAGAVPESETEERRVLPVRVSDGRALRSGARPLGKALRPLRQRFPDPRQRELDVAGTVAAMAETGLPETVTRPSRSRWLSLTLLVDDGVSMVLWQRLAAEVRTLMERVGAFRHIRVHGLETRGPQAPRLHSRPFGRRGPHQPMTSVSDPTGDALVLIVSDGVGAAWWDGRMRAVTEFCARRGPVAIVHALPARLWSGSGIETQRWRVTSLRRGGPNAAWHLADPVLPAELASFDSVPVPVLSPTPESFADWASLIASPGASTLLPLWSGAVRGTSFPSSDAPWEEDEAASVLRFRDLASPEAYRLAGHLAACAPLSPPVMRLIQSALGPPTDEGHVVEVFLGGLMRSVEEPDAETRLPHQRLFDFTGEARRLLLGAVPTPELLRTTRIVADLLKDGAGRSPSFRAWAGHPRGSAAVGEADQPFGWMEDRLLRRLGVPRADLRPAGAESHPLSTERPTPREAVLTSRSGPGHLSLRAPLGWSPLRPGDPGRLGRYRLVARSESGWNALRMYLARDDTGAAVTLRSAAPSLPVFMAKELLRTEADCLTRMDGIHAPRLLALWDEDADGPPWLAATYVSRRELDEESGPAPNLRAVFGAQHAGKGVDLALFRRVARDLVTAVARAHRLGLAHGALVPKAVLVTDHGVRLIGWITATRDEERSPHLDLFARAESEFIAPESGTGPTPEGDMYSLGALLAACATGQWGFARGEVGMTSALRASGLEREVADGLLRCLDRSPAERPTAEHLVELFTRVSYSLADASSSGALRSTAERVDGLRAAARNGVGARPLLGEGLNDLSNRLADAGEHAEALAAVAEAVEIYRGLADADAPREIHRPQLARCLSNLSVRLEKTGRHEEALAAIMEAVEIRREPTEHRDLHRADLATVLNNLSNSLAESGQGGEALAAITEAVGLWRELVDRRADTHRPGLAMGLNNLSNRLGEQGRYEEALAAITEAVGLYREMDSEAATGARPLLATGLHNLAIRLGALDRRAAALSMLDEAIALRRQLVDGGHRLHEEDLAHSLRVRTWLEG
ncbi:hypothetical protein GCM10022227_27650 [Streptomyces sedi]|nr:SAV_2336 N-terminal domain-related protein [Streptomyces sedi]